MQRKQVGRVLHLARLLVVLFAAAHMMPGQTAASLTGRVTDPSDAIIPGVTVTVTNTATQIAHTTITNGDGYYFVPFLPPGPYQVQLKGNGFKVLQRSGLVLEVAEAARLDFKLEVGDVRQSVQVQSTVPLLNVENATVGQVIDNKQILDLPLNGRDFTQLATLVPGATSLAPSGSEATSQLSINGARSNGAVFMVDGISITEQFYDGAALNPSIDAIQEFNVQSNALSAEYGQGNAVVNVQLKSGTNDVHGSAFEFFRNQVLDASNYFSQGQKAPLRYNQFGGTLGGPLTIPHVLKGKNRNFFFVDYQGSRVRNPNTQNNPTATQAMREGNFAGLGPIIDPTTSQPFPNDQIPASRLSPQAQYFLKFIPLPNSGVFPQQTYVYSASNSSQTDQFDVRTDHRISDSDNLSVSYSLQGLTQYSPGPSPVNGGVSNSVWNQAARLHEVHTISPTTVNELHLGYLRFNAHASPQGEGTNYTVLSGMGGFNETSLQAPGFPNLYIDNYIGIDGNVWYPFHSKDNKYDVGDTFMMVKGAHTIKLGGDMRWFSSADMGAAQSRGNFWISNEYTGVSFADFMLGLPTYGSRTFPRNEMGIASDRNFGYFVQDDWKVSSRVTLNLGLRYELNFLPRTLNNQAASYDLKTGDIVIATDNGVPNLTAQQVTQYVYPMFKDIIVTDRSVGLDNSLRHMPWNNWAPRVGLAVQAARNTVFRAGYGWFYLLSNANQTGSTLVINPPFLADELGKYNAYPTPTATLATLFPDPSKQYNLGPLAVHSIDPNALTPYLQEWNASLQHLIGGFLSVETAYVGSKGTHLDSGVSFNVPLPGPGSIQERRPNPRFAAGTIVGNGSFSTYNALQSKAQIKNWKGLSLLASYAFAKSIDNVSNNPQWGGMGDPNNQDRNKGVSDFDVKHRFVSSINYALPFARGKKTLFAQVVGNWDIGSILTVQSGMPFTPTIETNLLNNGVGNYPDRIASGQVADRTLTHDFDPTAFKVPAQYIYGNCGRNILYSRGFANLDSMIKRNFAITERVTLQARGEFFNLTNTPHFGAPDADIQSPTAGQIFSAGAPRDIQLALKLRF